MHILLVRFSSMGDVVLQTATVNWLRSLFGQKLRLTFVTSKEFVSLLDSHPGIDQVLGFDRKGGEKWHQFVDRIDQLDRKNPIDLILDLHGTLRSLRLKFSFWTIPALTVDKRRWERFFLTKIKSVVLRRLVHEKVFGLGPQVERIILDLESIFSGTQSGNTSGLWAVREKRQGPHGELTSLATPAPFELPTPYIVLAPSASFHYKRWPIQSFVELAKCLLQRLPHQVVVLAGPDDTFCDAFKEIPSERIHNLQGKTNLQDSMSILSRSSLCIGNDSGMNHITEAYGVPCVTLFGPTDPRFGFVPHGNKSAYISKELWCKPCSTTGKSDCFRESHLCMELISVEEVLEKATLIVEQI